jgi:hypothetical protein
MMYEELHFFQLVLQEEAAAAAAAAAVPPASYVCMIKLINSQVSLLAVLKIRSQSRQLLKHGSVQGIVEPIVSCVPTASAERLILDLRASTKCIARVLEQQH